MASCCCCHNWVMERVCASPGRCVDVHKELGDADAYVVLDPLKHVEAVVLCFKQDVPCHHYRIFIRSNVDVDIPLLCSRFPALVAKPLQSAFHATPLLHRGLSPRAAAIAPTLAIGTQDTRVL